MKTGSLRIPAVLVFGALLLASSGAAQTAPSTPESPYGGTTVEDIIVRVNDQIVTQSDYERAMQEEDQEARSHGATMQQIADQHKDLLRNLIDQQIWLSKGKELGINGDTELVKRLDDIRKQYNMASIDDLEQAAKEQGVSFEDFKANIRNGIITQEVIRDEVGQRIQVTPGESIAYYEQHKQDYVQPESVRLSEILVSTGTPSAPDAITGAPAAEDPAKIAAAQAKADDIEARLHAGGDFAQLARSFSDGPTASEGGELGQYKRGGLASVIETATFALQSGQYTAPIRTRQGFAIFKVEQHITGGVPAYKDVQEQVEEALYMERMEPAIRTYLTQQRVDSFIDIKPGYVDSGASPNESKPVFSAYVPPAPKKKAKVERTRYRESTRTFRQKSPQDQGPAAAPADEAPAETAPAGAAAMSSPSTETGPAAPAAASESANASAASPTASAAGPTTANAAAPTAANAPAAKTKKTLGLFKRKSSNTNQASEKPGKKEKIRFGQAPRETLPTATTNTGTVNAGALPETASTADVPVNPLEAAPVQTKSRYSARAKTVKKVKTASSPKVKVDALAPPPPEATEVADRQTQAAPLGLAGDTSTTKKKKKKTATTTTEKTRLSQEPKKPAAPAPQITIPAPVPGAPAPAPTPAAPAAQPQQ